MSIIAITGILSTGKYDLAVIMPVNKSDSLALIRLSSGICLIFSIVILIPVLFFNESIAKLLGNETIAKWLYIVPLSTFLVGIFQILSVWSNREKRYKLIAGANLSQSVVNSGVKLFTSRFVQAGGGLILGAVTGQIVGAIAYIYRFLRDEGKAFMNVPRHDVRQVALTYSRFPRYNLLHSLVNNFSANLPVFVLSASFSQEITGLYSLAFMMINRPMSLVTNAMGQVLSQRVIEKYNRGEVISGDVKRVVWRLFLLGILPFLFTGIFGPRIFSFVFGNSWFEAGKFMQILLPWLFMVFISSPLSFIPDLLKRQKKAMWIDIIKFILRILALITGVLTRNVTLAIIIFSGVSFILVMYYFYWCLYLAKTSDQER